MFEAHSVSFTQSDNRWSATCTCGWGFNSPSKTECELKASIHDLDNDEEEMRKITEEYDLNPKSKG